MQAQYMVVFRDLPVQDILGVHCRRDKLRPVSSQAGLAPRIQWVCILGVRKMCLLQWHLKIVTES
jgi:hypothetical protein